jgi:hypothetical protein
VGKGRSPLLRARYLVSNIINLCTAVVAYHLICSLHGLLLPLLLLRYMVLHTCRKVPLLIPMHLHMQASSHPHQCLQATCRELLIGRLCPNSPTAEGQGIWLYTRMWDKGRTLCTCVVRFAFFAFCHDSHASFDLAQFMQCSDAQTR